jgi:enamine deaminase RidA (YjgF/YER057c/UK114 family)
MENNMAEKNNVGRESVWPGLEAGVPKPLMPYSPAMKGGDWVFIAGQIASDFATGIAPEVREAMETNPFLHDELELQSRFVLNNLANTINATGCDIQTDMVRIWQWLVTERPDAVDFAAGRNVHDISIEPYLRVRRELIGDGCPPSSALAIRELLCFGTKVEVDMICIADGQPSVPVAMPDDLALVPETHQAGLRHGDWVFLAAQNAADMPGLAAAEYLDSPVERQTHHVLAKLSRMAEAAGTSLEQAVKADVYIGHPRDFADMDRVWRHWFPNQPPARVVIPYLGMGNSGNRVEIALTLLADDASLRKEIIETSDAPEPLGHEPQAVKVGDLLFFSTQMAFDSSGKLAPGMVRDPAFPWYGSPAQAQMRYMMGNVSAICEAAGTHVDQIVRRVCFHSDFQWFAESITEWASYFPDDKPASTTLRLGGPLVVPGADTLLDLIAYVPD